MLASPDVGRLMDSSLSQEEWDRILAESMVQGNMRDAFMAENIAWILAHEQKYYGKYSIVE